MKQLFLEKGTVKALTTPTPLLKPNDILVKVYYSFISSGTEGATISESKKSLLHKCFSNTTDKINKVMGTIKENGFWGTTALIKGSLNQIHPIGYSCSGQVIETGKNVTTIKPGDFVACAGAKIANHAEYISVPRLLAIKLSNKTHLKQASLTTIGAIALQGIRRADLRLGESVCVIGLGLIGQLTVQLAKLSGCTVHGIDIDDSKLFLAQKLGCDHVYNSFNINAVKDIIFNTQHHGTDKTIITAASQSGKIIQQAMEITRRKGKVVLVGDVKIDFNRSPFYEKEIDFLISCSYGPGRYDAAYEHQAIDYPYDYVRWTENRNMQLFAELIETKKIIIDPLISHEFDFENAPRAYEFLMQRRSLGLLLRYESAQDVQEIAQDTEQEPIAYAKTNKKTCVAFIGAGGFAKIKLLPIISHLKNTEINTIIDTDPAIAINIAKLYNAKNSNNDYKTILNNQEINTVVIATPHAFHAQQAIDFLSAGKSVFVEKPAAVTQEQYLQLKEFLTLNNNNNNNSNNNLFCVDFNRSFAPFITKIKNAIKNRTTPLVIHYRMNAGFIPKDHWIQSQYHGGRIIGEACHIFELFNFLTDSYATKVSVNTIKTTRDDLMASDNFSTQILYNDGSICTLLYTAIGNTTEMGKERLELFYDGKSIVMDDYKTLYGFGLNKSFNETTKHADKGHETLIKLFFEAVQHGLPSPISTKRILAATKLTLEVNSRSAII